MNKWLLHTKSHVIDWEYEDETDRNLAFRKYVYRKKEGLFHQKETENVLWPFPAKQSREDFMEKQDFAQGLKDQ